MLFLYFSQGCFPEPFHLTLSGITTNDLIFDEHETCDVNNHFLAVEELMDLLPYDDTFVGSMFGQADEHTDQVSNNSRKKC